MKRIGCSVLLDMIGIVALMVFLVFPASGSVESISGLNSALQSLLCQKGETLKVESYSYSSEPGETSYSANFYCLLETTKRDVTGRAILFGGLGFGGSLVLSIILMISGVTALARNKTARMTDQILQGNAAVFSTAGGMNTRGSATERLKTLKSAYEQGLITETEYESKRQEILRDV